MKEIALLGTPSRIFGDVLGKLLKHDINVNAMVGYPEKIMLADTKLTVTQLDPYNKERTAELLKGYDTAVLVYNDDLTDVETNQVTHDTFAHTAAAAREAGVKRLLVVGSENSEALFVTDLRRLEDIDWVFISNVGPYAKRVRKEIEEPRCHKQIYEPRNK